MRPSPRSWHMVFCVLAFAPFGDVVPAGSAKALADATQVAAPADSAALRAAAALYEGIRTETLPNGLRVYLKPVPGAATVTTMVAYKVGSSDEDLDNTGLSHYLEHLMFKGTDKIMPGDIDRVTLRNGGQNNAYTSEDYTIYHFDFAADRWEVALEIEADRMRNLRIDAKHEFEQEKGAVVSELEMDEDQLYDLESKTIVPLLFALGTSCLLARLARRIYGETGALWAVVLETRRQPPGQPPLGVDPLEQERPPIGAGVRLIEGSDDRLSFRIEVERDLRYTVCSHRASSFECLEARRHRFYSTCERLGGSSLSSFVNNPG